METFKGKGQSMPGCVRVGEEWEKCAFQVKLLGKAGEKGMSVKPEREGTRDLCTSVGQAGKVKGPAGPKGRGRNVFVPRMFQKHGGRP